MKPTDEVRYLARTIANLMRCIIERDRRIAAQDKTVEEMHAALTEAEAENAALLTERDRSNAAIRKARSVMPNQMTRRAFDAVYEKAMGMNGAKRNAT